MNPFELPGPQFLVFYAALGVALAIALVLVRRAYEPDASVAVQLTDPYEIACLRGGDPNDLSNEGRRQTVLEMKFLTRRSDPHLRRVSTRAQGIWEFPTVSDTFLKAETFRTI